MIHRKVSRALLAACLLSTTLLAQPARAADEYVSEVWFDVLFDENGQAKDIKPVNESEHPAGFWTNLTQRLQSAKIPPRTQDGKPATFRTGVVFSLLVNKSGNDGKGSVTLKGLDMRPLPIKRYAAGYPKDVERTGGWTGEVMATCTIDKSGACTDVVVEALPGMPESVRKWAKISAEGWQFKPQELNGQPQVSKLSIPFTLNTLDDKPRDFRDIRKL